MHQKFILFCKIALLWVGLWINWMLFISQWNRSDASVGCVAAAFTIIAIWLVKKEFLSFPSAHLQWFLAGFSIPKYVLSGTIEAFKAMILQVFKKDQKLSILQFVPFEVGSQDFSSEVLMALAVIYTTCTPNFVILGIDYQSGESHGKLIYHQLLRTPVPKMTQKLGAKP